MKREYINYTLNGNAIVYTVQGTENIPVILKNIQQTERPFYNLEWKILQAMLAYLGYEDVLDSALCQSAKL